MNLLIDTNVIIDLALDRRPFSNEAAQLLDALETRQAQGFIAWHSISNFYYLVKPEKGSQRTINFIEDLIGFIEVAPTTTDDMTYALKSDLKDFEDSMQIAAALACRADFLVTRNVKDFRGAPLRVVSPREALLNIAPG